MKKRYLRAKAEYALITIIMFCLMALLMINDFDLNLKSLIIIGSLLLIIITGIVILKKYGKGRLFEKWVM